MRAIPSIRPGPIEQVGPVHVDEVEHEVRRRDLDRLRGQIFYATRGYPETIQFKLVDDRGEVWWFATDYADYSPSDPDALLGHLPSDLWGALVLQVIGGFTTEEIARELSLSATAVLTRLFRARKQLRVLCGEDTRMDPEE